MRRPFAGTGAEVLVDTTGINGGAAVRVYDAETGGAQITDLQNPDGAAILDGLLVAGANGKVPRFLGPDDGRAVVWLDAGFGRIMALATDTPARQSQLEAAAVRVNGQGQLIAPGGAVIPTGGTVDPTQLQAQVEQQVFTAAIPKPATVAQQSVVVAKPDGTTAVRVDRGNAIPYFGPDVNQIMVAAGLNLLDSYQNQAGTLTDDQLLTAALQALGQGTYKSPILLSHRAYTFSEKRYVPAGIGFRIGVVGGPSASNSHRSDYDSQPLLVNLRTAGAWITAVPDNGQNVFGISLSGLPVKGGALDQPHSSLITTTDGAIIYNGQFDNITAAQLDGVFGTGRTGAIAMTLCQVTGQWEINTCFDEPIHAKGSDNFLFSNGCSIDANPAHQPVNSASLFHADYLDKTQVGRIYITAQGNWRALTVDGPAYGTVGDNSGYVKFSEGSIFMGKNQNDGQNNGGLICVNGGHVLLKDADIEFGGINPGGGSSLPDFMILSVGGFTEIDGLTYDRSTGVSQDYPLMRAGFDNTHIDMRRVKTATKGGTWTDKPLVSLSAGSPITPGNAYFDDSVRVVTV